MIEAERVKKENGSARILDPLEVQHPSDRSRDGRVFDAGFGAPPLLQIVANHLL
jgi:hypothetical protein